MSFKEYIGIPGWSQKPRGGLFDETENKSNIDIHSASIVVILKKEGNIVGGGYAYSDELNAKQNDTFEMYVSGYPEYDSYEMSSHVAMIN